MQETMPGARRRGRPRPAWMDNIKTWTGLPVEESIRMTEDRDKWRKYVHGVMTDDQPSDRGRFKNRIEPRADRRTPNKRRAPGARGIIRPRPHKHLSCGRTSHLMHPRKSGRHSRNAGIC